MLTGKTALITGSLGGIGFATARALAAQGCNIMLNGFADPATIQARVAALEALGVHAEYHGADLRHPEQIAALVRAATQAFGAVDILVNNAVVRHFGAMENFSPEHWDEALAVRRPPEIGAPHLRCCAAHRST